MSRRRSLASEVLAPRGGWKGMEREGGKGDKNSPAVQVHWKWRGCWLRRAISQKSQNNKRNIERDCLEEQSLCGTFMTAFKMGENCKGGWNDVSISKHVVPAGLWPGGLLGCLSALRSLESWGISSIRSHQMCGNHAGIWMCFTGQEKGTKSEKVPA